MTRRRLTTAAVALVLLCGTLCRSVPAQDPQPPNLVEKLSVRLDFEKDIDSDDFPDEWVLLVGRRHPQDIRVRLDVAEHYSGRQSFLMELDGIANVYETMLAYRLDPRFSHRLSGYIKTSGVPSTGLRASWARIELVGIASDEKTVVSSSRTEGITATTEWTRVSLDIPRDVTRTFRLVRIRCIIDGVAIGGKVWFDDITLEPRPTIHVQAGKPEGFFSPDDAHRTGVSLDTLIGPDYKLSAKLADPTGRTVMSRTLDITPRLGFLADAELALPLERFGLYQLHLELSSAGKPVSSLAKSFLHWPGMAGGRVSPRFGVYTRGLDRLDAGRAEMLLESRFGTVGFDLFAGTDGPDNVTTLARRAAPRVGRLRQQRVEPVAVLATVPRKLANALFREKQVLSAAQASWLRTLSLDSKYWSQLIADVPPALTARTVHWQIGRRADHNVSPDDLVRAVGRLRAALKPLTYRRKIGVVFDGTESPEMMTAAAVCDFIVLDRSDQTDAAKDLPQLVPRLKSIVEEVWVSLSVSSDEAREPGASEKLVEGTIRAWAAGADRVNVRFVEGMLDANGNPHKVVATAAALARELSGKWVAGALATNARAFLLVGPTGSRLAVIGTPDAPADVLYLGKDPRRIDTDGNVTPVTMFGDKTLLENTGRPYFISGLDTEALLTRLSLRIAAAEVSRPQLWAEVRPQTLQIQLVGCLKTSVIGTLEIIGPAGWKIERPRWPIRLDVNTPTLLETRLEVPITEAAGEHVLTFKLGLEDRKMVVRRRLLVKPRGIDTTISRRRTPDGRWQLAQKITNRDPRPARLALFVSSADTGRMERYVNGLAPGASTEVTFDLGKVGSGKVWIGWRETAGPRFFNQYLTLANAPE